MKIGAQLKAENGKFIIGLKKKITDGGPVIIQLEAPMLVHNCLPLPITMQFLVGGKTFMKEMPAQ